MRWLGSLAFLTAMCTACVAWEAPVELQLAMQKLGQEWVAYLQWYKLLRTCPHPFGRLGDSASDCKPIHLPTRSAPCTQVLPGGPGCAAGGAWR